MAASATPVSMGPPILRNLSGKWEFIRERCDSLEPWLESNGFNLLARKIMKSADVVSSITQSRSGLVIEEKSRWGKVTNTFYLDGNMHTGVDYQGRRIRTIATTLKSGDIEMRTYSDDGSLVIDTRTLESRTTMVRRMEHWKPGQKLKPGSGVMIAPKHAGLPEHLVCTALCSLVYGKVETDAERVAGEEAEQRAAQRLAKRLFGPSWASLAVPQYGAPDMEEAAPSVEVASPAAVVPVSTPASEVPSIDAVPPQYCLTGSWVLDEARSDPLEVLLKEMGVPWIARKAAAALSVTTTMRHTRREVVIVDKSKLFENKTPYILDAAPHPKTGDDGKVVHLRAWNVLPEFVIPGDVPKSAEEEFKMEGTFVYNIDLPDGKGRMLEMRFREGDGMVVKTEYYTNREERKAIITRRWLRSPPGNPMAVAVPPSHLESSAPPPPPPSSSSSGGPTGTSERPPPPSGGASSSDSGEKSSGGTQASGAPITQASSLELLRSKAMFVHDGVTQNFTGRWKLDGARYQAFADVMAGFKIAIEPIKASDILRISQTPTSVVFEGVSSLLLHGAVVLTDNRPHDVVDASGKRKLAVTSYVDEDSDELVVDVALGGEGHRRVHDVFAIDSSGSLRRTTTVLIDEMSTTVVISHYSLQQTDAEKVAAVRSHEIQVEREKQYEETAKQMLAPVSEPKATSTTGGEQASQIRASSGSPLTKEQRLSALRGPMIGLAVIALLGLVLCEAHSVEIGVALIVLSAGMMYWLVAVLYPPIPSSTSTGMN